MPTVKDIVDSALKPIESEGEVTNEQMAEADRVIREAGITSILVEQSFQDEDALEALQNYLKVHRVPAETYYFKDDFLYIYFTVRMIRRSQW
jgi:ABC-type Zn uptake system ZnuABC Zn-binding protein ZnuA